MRVYFDHNASTPLCSEALCRMNQALNEFYGNPSSIHHDGQKARHLIEKTRSETALELGCKSSEIYFTSGGTESDNIALQGVMQASERRVLVISPVEHPAVYKTAEYLETRGFTVRRLEVDHSGKITEESLEKCILPDTALVSVIHVSNEIGTVQNLGRISEYCRRNGALFHTDAVQSFGKLQINVQDCGVDLLSASAHKIYGPKGAGILYVRKGIKLSPLFFGGAHEKKLRAGTEAVHNIAGFHAALKVMQRQRASDVWHITDLREKLKKGILEKVSGIIINSPENDCIYTTLNISVQGVEGEALLTELDMKGISVSAGSACSSGNIEPSPVLVATGRQKEAFSSLRITPGRGNNNQDVEYFLSVFPEIVERLRSMTPSALA